MKQLWGLAFIFLSLAPAFAATGTTTTLQASTVIAGYGQAITLTATVSDGTVSGKVAFYDGGNILGTAAAVNGIVTLPDVLLIPGTHSLYARYLGDVNFEGSQSAPISEMIQTHSTVSWLNSVGYSTGFVPAAFALGDLNNDGITDVVVAGSSVAVFLGHGDGTFRESYTSVLPSPATAVSISDFNTDGKADVVLAIASGLAVFPGNGDGTLKASVVTPFTPTPSFLVVSDFNLDGNPDLALPSGAMLLGNGDGSFRQGSPFSTTPVTYLVAADVNLDGKSDLIGGTENSVITRLGNDDGTFQTGLNSNTGTNGYILTAGVADFNNDGIPDLLVANFSPSVMFGNDDGTFQAALQSSANVATSLAFSDLNADGYLDVAAFFGE